MRVIVFFDLPSVTTKEKREYRNFRKFLIGEGFLMMQESIYSKIVLNNTVANSVKERVRKNKAKKGLIQMLVITEKQYAGIEYIIGESKNKIINNTDRMIIL